MSLTTTGGAAMVPQNLDQAMKLAEWMARAKLLPDHFKNDAASCLLVIEQAARWQMSPFAVAQATSNIRGKLMFEGKLVAAALETSGQLGSLIDYKFSGEGTARTVTVSAVRRGESEPRTVEVKLSDVVTENGIWKKQPDQQLCYAGARIWARRWAPAVMLGVYSPEDDFEEEAPKSDTFEGQTIDGSVTTSEHAATEPDPDIDAQKAAIAGIYACTSKAELRAYVARPDIEALGNRLKEKNPEAAEELRKAYRIKHAALPPEREPGAEG